MISVWSFIWTIILTPLLIIGKFPGVTLALGAVIVFFTIKKYSTETTLWRKIKLWLCAVVAVLYGLYDIYAYQNPHRGIRFDLVFVAPIYYFVLLNWLLIYRKVITL